jgi:hypothetical protein
MTPLGSQQPRRSSALTNVVYLGDERRPQCQRCEARGYICQWGLKASFHPSRSLRLSTPERAALLAIEKGRQDPAADIQSDNQRSSLEPSAPIVSGPSLFKRLCVNRQNGYRLSFWYTVAIVSITKFLEHLLCGPDIQAKALRALILLRERC